MAYKKIIPFINGENELAANVVKMAEEYCFSGADELFLYNYSKIEKEREEFLHTLKEVSRKIDIPFMAGMYVERFEDAKKVFYTGADKVVIKNDLCSDIKVLNEVVDRFGADKIILEIAEKDDFEKREYLVNKLLLKHVDAGSVLAKKLNSIEQDVIIRDGLLRNDLEELLKLPQVQGVSTNYFEGKDLMAIKYRMEENGIEMNTFKTKIDFDKFVTDEKGLIPCIAQDYRTGEVLMLAYMNEESFKATCESGRMTYYSRSRQELWCKGDTSGNFQYVKELTLDCDKDTILAKVHQIGVACHTGARSCFFQELIKKEYMDTNPLTVLQEDFEVISTRKKNPREGSYTNYLFDKGIDKILKKCGEEATEIVIAAKNPDAEELKYEISDFLYHLMVLMVECDLTWEDVVKELVNRRS